MLPSPDTARVIVSVGSLLLIFSATQAIARPPQHNHSPPQLSPLVRSRQLTTTTTTTTATLAAQPIQLDESSWHRVLEGEWLLLATAFGCQSCKRLEPEWRQLAELAADHEHWHLGLRVGSLDFTSNAAMSARFQVRQLPTLFHAKDGVFRLYTGPRDHQSLMRFVQEQSWKMVEPMALSFLPRASSSPYAPNKAANKQQVGVATATATGVSMGQPFETQTTGSQMMRPMQHNSQYQQYMSGQQQQASMNPYTNASHMLLLDLRQQLIDRGVKFNDHFRGLLSESKRSLNNMFEDTYGMMYLQNTEIFTNMYDSLEQYYATGEVELTKSMENFFERLYQKIFQVINLNRVFSQQYLKCATQQLAELRPFRDAPDKLIADIRHALVAARTLSWALNAGIDIIKSVISLGQPPQCTSMINERLLKANPLSSTTSARTADQSPAAASKVPCLGYCEQVIARCVGRANLDPLNERWRAYVVALAELGKKLTSQYNIITIIGPIDVQISEAIMNFQENSKNITEQVFQACGDVSINKQTMLLGGSSVGAPMAPSMSAGGSQSRPVLNRLGKRAAPAAPAVSSSLYFDAPMHSNQQRRGHQPMQHLQPSTHRGQSLSPAHGRAATSQQLAFASGLYGSQLDPLALGGATGASIDEIDPANLPLIQMRRKSPLIIGDIRDYILSTKNFWSQLPNSICTSAILAINANFTSGGSSSSAYNSQNSNYLRRNVIASTQANCFQEPLTQGTSDLHPQQNTQDLRFRDETQKQVARLELVHSKIMDALRGVEIDWSTQSVSPTQQQQQQPPRQPSSTAVQLGEAGATSGSPDDDDLDNPDEDQIEPGSGDDMDDADGHDLTEDNDHEPTTSEPTEPDECAEDDDPLCLPGESTTPTLPDGPDANGSHHEEGAGGPAVEGTTVVPPSISVNGDIGDPLTNGKPSINTDLIGTNDLISAVDQSAQKSSAGHGSAVHQLFVIQSSFSSIVQMLFSQCVLMVLALSVVTHNNQHHHLRPMHHNH